MTQRETDLFQYQEKIEACEIEAKQLQKQIHEIELNAPNFKYPVIDDYGLDYYFRQAVEDPNSMPWWYEATFFQYIILPYLFLPFIIYSSFGT